MKSPWLKYESRLADWMKQFASEKLSFTNGFQAIPGFPSNGFRAALKANYEAPRRRDNALMMSAMDGFYILFSNDLAPIKWFRNQLLSVAQRIEPAKREVLKYAIGLR